MQIFCQSCCGLFSKPSLIVISNFSANQGFQSSMGKLCIQPALPAQTEYAGYTLCNSVSSDCTEASKYLPAKEKEIYKALPMPDQALRKTRSEDLPIDVEHRDLRTGLSLIEKKCVEPPSCLFMISRRWVPPTEDPLQYQPLETSVYSDNQKRRSTTSS